ncbi:hypothetical protein [Deinococcus cavernae]|uniref:hypothetical protein n=1 Tax=Deinococcus cavernae TaxID=2320857 RepID=UPI0011C2175D|nr:hypothetical protein [Deinococcus cavernae]
MDHRENHRRGRGRVGSARQWPLIEREGGKEDTPDWPALASEQRAVLTDLKQRLDELEDSAARKDRFIVQLLRDCQTYQRTINDLERDLNRPLTPWEIKLTDEEAA